MVDRRRTTSGSRTPRTRTFRTKAEPSTKERFGPVRGDLQNRAKTALRDRGGQTPEAPGRSTGGGPGQGAIDFGREMTGGDGPIQRVKDDIVRGVAEHLASKGIYQDERGSWQIAGLERDDGTRGIRDSAVHAMGGPSWDKIVADADARLGANNIGLPRSAVTMPVPQTSSPGGTPGIPGRPTLTPPRTPRTGGGMPPVNPITIPGAGPTSTRPPTPPLRPPDPNVIGTGPGGRVIGQGVPRTGGVPAPVPLQPTIPGAGPSATRPIPAQHTPMTIGGLGQVLGDIQVAEGNIPPPSNGFLPQGQGVGRGTTPTGAQVDPTKYPPTQGSNFQTFGGQAMGLAYPNGAPKENIGAPVAGDQIGLGGNRVGLGVSPNVYAMQPYPGAPTPGGPTREVPTTTPLGGIFGGTDPASFPGTPTLTLPQAGNEVVQNAGIFGQKTMTVPAGTTTGTIMGNMQQGMDARQGTTSGPAVAPPQMMHDPGREPSGQLPVWMNGQQPNQQGITSQPQPQPQQQFPGGPQTPFPPAGGYPPISPSTIGNQVIDPNASQQGRIGGGTGGQIIGSGMGPGGLQQPPGITPGGTTPAPISPSTTGNQVIPPGNTVSRAAPTTPTRPPITPPLRPGQMPTRFPNGQPFGGPNPQVQAIQDMVNQRIQAQMGRMGGGVPGMPGGQQGQGNPALAGLQGLGDRIGQTVQAGLAGMRQQQQQPGVPRTAGQPGLPGLQPGGVGNMANDIMQRVQQQLAQSRMPGRPDVMNQTPGTGQPIPGQVPGQPPGGAPAPAPAGSIGAPQGTIQGSIGFGIGGDWANVNQYDASYVKYGQQYGVDPAMLKAMAVIESGGQMIQGPGGAYGVMQIKGNWASEAARLGYDLNTADGQIGFAAAFLGGQVQGVSGSTPEERFLNSYYPTDCLDCPPVDGNGITQRMYLDSMHDLMGQINAANTGGTTPVQAPGGPAPTTIGQGPGGQTIGQGTAPNTGALGLPPGGQQVDPNTGIVVTGAGLGGTTPIVPGTQIGGPGSESPARAPIASGQISTLPMPSGGIAASPDSDETWMSQQAGGAAAPVTSEYKCSADGTGCYVLNPDWYVYQTGHGATNQEHAAYDIGYAEGTPISATPMLTGTVECSGCGSYCTSDQNLKCDGAGVGEIRVKLDPGNQGGNQITMVYGHMLTSNVEAGQQLTSGAQIGSTGHAGSGPHLHQEARAYCPGQGWDQDYKYVDPTLVADGYYQTHDACAE